MQFLYLTHLEARFFPRAANQAEPAGRSEVAFAEDLDSGDSKPGLSLWYVDEVLLSCFER